MNKSVSFLHKTPPDDGSLYLMDAGIYEAPQGKDFPLHFHPVDAPRGMLPLYPTWELVYYRTGTIEALVGDTRYPIQPGTVLIVPPGCAHAEYAHTSYSNYWLWLQAPSDRGWPLICLDNAAHTFESICGSLVREFQTEQSDAEVMISALVTQLDILLRRYLAERQPPRTERMVEEAERIMKERFSTSLTLESVAHEVNASPSYLRAQFMRLRGQTMMNYLHTLRVQHAMSLIRTTDFPLDIIAGICGFDSASHLSRYVKRITGKSPGSFRREDS